MIDPGQTPLTRKQKQEEKIVEKVLAAISEHGMQEHPVKQEDLSKIMRFMETARVIAASALLAAMLAALYEYLALMEITSVSPARVVLFCAWLFGTIFIWEMGSLFSSSTRRRLQIMAAGALVIAAGFVLMDHEAIVWRRKHPPEIAKLATELHGIGASIEQLTEKASGTHVANEVIKEIKPVPGYLKLDFRYPHLPMDQVQQAAEMDVLYINEGSTYTHDSTMKGNLYYVDFHGVRPSVEHDPKIEQMIKDSISAIPFGGAIDVAPGAAIYSTYTATTITQEVFDNLQSGTARIYLGTIADWNTNGVPDHAWSCLWLQPSSWNRAGVDASKNRPTWHKC